MEKTTKLLIADESPEERRHLRDFLRNEGYRNIEEASNGEEAISKINRTHPDIVIVDTWLSRLDGISVIRGVKSISFAPDKAPNFVLVSLVAGNSLFVEGVHAGADICLSKPCEFDSLRL